jgi:hypothetical protein
MTFQIALQCTLVRSLPTPLKAIAKRFHHSLSYMDMKPNNIIPHVYLLYSPSPLSQQPIPRTVPIFSLVFH